MAKGKITISKTPRDVAQALGLPPSRAIEWQVRYDLTKKIISLVKSQKLTVSEVAKRAGTSRARVTKILKEETEDISIDILLRVVGALGSSVKLSFRKAA